MTHHSSSRRFLLLSLVGVVLAVLPARGDLFDVAKEINETLYSCDWLYREIHEWGRENGDVVAYLAGPKSEDVAGIRTALERNDDHLADAEATASPAPFASTVAFATAQRAVCEAALTPSESMEEYAGTVERELARARGRRSEVEAVFGRSLDAVEKLSPDEYARKKEAWEAYLREREATEKEQAEAERAAIEAWQRERAARQMDRQDRSQDRSSELLEAQEQEQARQQRFLEDRRAEIVREMEAWYATYRGEVGGVKSALGEVLAGLRGETGALLPACRKLQEEMRLLEGKPKIFESPEPTASHALRAAYNHLRGLAVNCIQGKMTKAREELDKAQVELATAAQILSVYGLRP